MVQVTYTIRLNLECDAIPSEESLNMAMQRAEMAAGAVFVNGDKGGDLTTHIHGVECPIAKVCETVNVGSGHISATVRRESRAKKVAEPKRAPMGRTQS